MGLYGHMVGHCEGRECHMVYPVRPQAQGAEDLHSEHVCHLMIGNQDLANVLQVQSATHGTHVLNHWICLCFQLVHHLNPHYHPMTYL